MIDSLCVTEYETQDGKLVRVNNKPGFYNIIPTEAILSKKTTIFGETVQVTGRSCEISNNVETQVEATGDFLSDILLFKFNGTIKLTETCMTSNGVITSDWEFTGKAHIELPISCSIESDRIKCGALNLTSNKVVTVEVGPTRMRKIVKQNVGEEKVKITGKVFRGNFTKINSFVSPPSTTLGLSTFYWVLIGAVSGSLVLIATIAGVCGYKIHNGRNTSESSKKTSGGNTFIQNDIQISNPESKFWYSSTRRKKNKSNNAMVLEDYPVQSARIENKCKELEGVLTMEEQQALEEKEAN